MKLRLTLGITAALLMASVTANAQYFGKNHVQYKDHKTFYLQSEHFDIYFTEHGEEIARFVGETSEATYREIKEDFRYELSDRITIIVYNNHNDFSSTNVTLSPGEESTGGFTEFFKNRVVIPYEGDWEKFRHVIHHELTHAIMLQMLFGSGVQSIITGISRLQVPLWFTEGLAEYESRGWDTESDMFIRDGALNGYIPAIHQLNAFLAYKGGQSVLYFLSEKYGHEKIGELLGKIKLTKSVDRGFRQAIGVGIDDLTKQWHKYLKKQYWPDITGRDEPADIAKQLTDHVKERNFINNSPALSPRGDKLVFLSDKSDYFDIYLMSAIDGKIISKLVSGQTSGRLENLHWLRPGLTWDPLGEQVAFASKAGAEDALNIVDVRSRKITKSMKFGLDGVFSPTWSPNGNEIAFVGMQHGQSDIYAVDLKTETLRKVTDDIFSDLEPTYSPDGLEIAFVSDRGDFVDMHTLPPGFDIVTFDYRNYDIYTVPAVGANGKPITRMTDTPFWEKSPAYSPDGKQLAFTSDRSGIYNVYLKNLETWEEYPITNVITGVSHLSWSGDGSRLAFTSFYYGGYDIYLLKNPLKHKPGDVVVEKTAFLKKLEKQNLKRGTAKRATVAESRESRSENKYQHYVFGGDFSEKETSSASKTVFLDTTQYKSADGSYKVREYKPRFSPDIVYGNTGYSQFFGVQGTAQIAFSDIFGNHRFELFTDLFYDMRNSNYALRYFFLPKRIDYGIGANHNVYFFYSNNLGLMRDRYFGGSFFASRPFDKFRRLDFSSAFLGINRDYFDAPLAPTRIRALINSLSYVKDTTVWGYTGPVNGSRGELSFGFSPKLSNSTGVGFATVRADYRKYIKFRKEYNLVFRFSGGRSDGSDPQLFFLGGMDNWLNLRFKGGIQIDNPESIYFSSFETPLRGTDYYEKVGDRFALMNMEFRFPLIRYLILGWPLPIGVVNVRGALFTDVGTAWQQGADPQFFRTGDGGRRLGDDLLMGYGIGARAFVGFFLLRFDAAWKTDLQTTSAKPRYYFSLGAEF